MPKYELSIIIPCYNEGATFEKSVQKIVNEIKKLKKTWEIIFVEDKSLDNTKDVVLRFTKKIKNCRAIYHYRNQGRGNSVADGLKVAKGEICGYLDVDLEVSEKYVPIFLKEVEKGNDLVTGKRFYEGGWKNLTRLLLSRVYALAVKMILNLPVDDTEAGYKFFNKKRILPILPKIKSKHWFWDTEICVRAYLSGFNISQVPVLFKRRHDKKSTVKLIPDTLDYINNLIRLKRELSSNPNRQ